MTTPEESKVLEGEAKTEWEKKNEEFKTEVIDRIKEELIRKNSKWAEEYRESMYYNENDEESYEYFLLMEKFSPMLKEYKQEYVKNFQSTEEELSEYSAWQICAGFGSTPSFEISPKFDLDGEKSIVKFFKEKLEKLQQENQE